MHKIQNNGPQHGLRASWGSSKQKSDKYYNRPGVVRAIVQRPAAAVGLGVVMPSLVDQAASAARDKGLVDYSAPLLVEIEAAFKLLCLGRHIPAPSKEVSTALLSGRLRAELDAKFNAAEKAGPQARQQQLTERDYATLHVAPHAHQGGPLEQSLVQRLQDCVPKSKWPGQAIAAAQATDGLNRFILDQLCDEEGIAASSGTASLRAALAGCNIYSSDGSLTESPMRCTCRLEALAASGLLPPMQKRTKVVLPSGLALSVELQPDNWQVVRVMMTGLSPEIKLADASFIVADLLKGTGAEFTLTAPSSQHSGEGSERQDGLKQLGIRLVPPPAVSASRGAQAVRQSKRDLVLLVRRDVVHELPPARAVLVITPATATQPEGRELTYIKFEVSAQDGHTDARKCHSCGRDGHIAATCTARHRGQEADYVVYAAPPTPPSRPSNNAAALSTQVPRSAASRPQAPRAPPPAPDADGFSTDRRTLKEPPARTSKQNFTTSSVNPTASRHAAGMGGVVASTSSAVQPPETVTGAAAASSDATAMHHDEQDDAVSEEVLALSEREELPNMMEQRLQARNEALALCLTVDGSVAPEHAERFTELFDAHTTGMTDLSEAHGRVKHTLTQFKAEPLIQVPSGKQKAKKGSIPAFTEEQRTAARKHNGELNMNIAKAKCTEARFSALKQDYQAFAGRLNLLLPPDVQPQNGPSPQLSPLTQTADFCESPLSPVIAMSPDSQDTPLVPPHADADALQSSSAEVADTVEAAASVPPHLTVSAPPAVTAHDLAANHAVPASSREDTPVPTTDREPPCASSETRAAELEQHRDAVLSANLTDFDLAERAGVRTEQARLLQVAASRAAAVSPVPGTAKQGTPENLGESETERSIAQHSDSESFDSGPSEGSESECSDAGSSQQVTNRMRKRQQQQQQQLQQQPPVSAQTPALTPGSAPTPRIVRQSTVLATEAVNAKLAAESAAKAAAASQALSARK